MTEREMYLAMAQWLREHGVTAAYRSRGCGCFMRARRAVCDPDTYWNYPLHGSHLDDVIGAGGFEGHALVEAGWDRRYTDDAVAACLIAADLAA